MKIIALVDTVGKKLPVDSSLLDKTSKISVKKGTEIAIISYENKGNNHILIIDSQKNNWYFYSPHITLVDNPLITFDQFIEIYRFTPVDKLQIYFLPLDHAMREFGITNTKRIAMFLAQLGHESGGLKYNEEIASGQAYEGRKDLGNTQIGDGKRYKGRGLIQLTGRANYREVGKALGVRLETQPTLAKMPSVSARIAAYFWHSRGLNKIADLNTLDAFKVVTKRINGGYNGLEDRLIYWNRAKRVLKC